MGEPSGGRSLTAEPADDPAAGLGLDLFAQTGGACLGLPGRCPFRSCRHHVEDKPARPYHRRGMVEKRLPVVGEPCAIKLGNEGPRSLDEIGGMFGLSRERVRQIIVRALKKARRRCNFER